MSSEVFTAVAHPVRRRVVELLHVRSMPVSDLVDQLPIGRAAVAEHLAVLGRAGLVDVEPVGRKRVLHLQRARLAELVSWAHAVGATDVPTAGAGVTTEAEVPASIAVQRDLAAAPAAVWAALTTAPLLARWWIAADVAPVVGHRFQLGATETSGDASACEVVLADPPHRFSFTVQDRWTVAWQLTATGEGTRVQLEMSGFDLAQPVDLDVHLQLRRAWPAVLLPALSRLVEQPADRPVG